MKKVWTFLRYFFSFIGGGIGVLILYYNYSFFSEKLHHIGPLFLYLIFFLFFFFIFYLLFPPVYKLINLLVNIIDKFLSSLSLAELLLGIFSVLISLLISYLFYALISKIPIVGPYIGILIAIFVFGVTVGTLIKRRKEILEAMKIQPKRFGERTPKEKKFYPKYLLDTSAIIDGRILELIDSGFIDGTIFIPTFILEELQMVADSEDSSKRVRGRRGLDILQRLKEEYPEKIKIFDAKGERIPIDTKLINLAKKMKAKVITTDFNLSQVARTRGIKVLNINELAHALRKVVLPGERLQVRIVKQGKERAQGVGYLDDGTMVVVEDGKYHIGEVVDVEVTSLLQGPTGTMIFGDIVNDRGSSSRRR